FSLRPDHPRTRWMVVDPNRLSLHLTARLLSVLGDAEIVCCESSVEALALVAATPHDFELVVTDLQLPDLNGIELCHRLRTFAPELPVVLATGAGAMSEADAARVGFAGVIERPFRLVRLKSILDQAGVFKPKTERNHFQDQTLEPICALA